MIERDMTMPAISIVTPVYNEEQWLEACVKSVLAQTFCDWELILIDDGSTDRSGMMCNDFAAQDARVHAIHQENRKFAGARNAGLDAARGDYVVFLDADDRLEPEGLEVLYRGATECDVDHVIGGDNIVMYSNPERTIIEGVMHGAPEEDYIFAMADLEEAGEYLIETCGPLFYCIWGRLYKMSIIRDFNLRFNNSQLVQEDVNWTFSYYYYCDKVLVTKEIVYDYSREIDKDDVGERDMINQHLCCEPSIQSFERLAFKFGYSPRYLDIIHHRLSEQFLNITSKIFQEKTGLTPEGKRAYVKRLSDTFGFRWYCAKLGALEDFWAGMAQCLESGDDEALYLGLEEKMRDDGLPVTGRANIR